MSENVALGRLAMRVEGENWVAYYALPDTMQDAVVLGSIRMGAVIDNPERKEAFMAMMTSVVAEIIEDRIGVRPSWSDTVKAPEHERSGRG